ncbi:hypothetical protein GCM10017786_24720 [Amycolatopsis deserti]|uniref:DUF3592 domain-containing protein n=1 Tax=Amycolatopsis deserti TaxID=185696 RepID=A0ABQ3IUD6_9PSEU|nr:hypothetical protein [Amycolatopsis deserti]GHE91339.1 hypothetical protein GCM10017786_24720 [Amycolatopsis deserti]
MTTGIASDDDVRRRRRTRNRFAGSCLAVVAVIGVLVAGAITGGLDGTQLGVAVALAILLSAAAVLLAVEAIYWHRFAQARARELASGAPAPPQRWVPTGPGDVGAAAHLSRLRVPAGLAAAGTVAFLGLLIFSSAEFDRITGEERELLETGTRVTATVVTATQPRRGDGTIEVTYPVGDTRRAALIELDTTQRFQPYQQVLVIYDPADPGRVRTLDDTNTDPVRLSMFVVPGLAGLAGTPVAAFAAVSWLRRYSSARRTGWHPASVVVTPVGRVFASYAEGGEIELSGGLSTRQPTRFESAERRPAWVGGEGTWMTVLFPRDGGKSPYAIPARASTPLLPTRHRTR